MLSTRTRLVLLSPTSSLRLSRLRCAPLYPTSRCPSSSTSCRPHSFFHSSSISPTQETILNAWISQTLSRNRTHTYTEDLSPSKLADLFCTLPTRSHLFDPTSRPNLTTDNLDESTSPPLTFAPGTPLPPLHTLIYFHPRTPEVHLGPDGTDTHLSPPSPFTRRMWAGGSFRFRSPSGLRLGHPATARTTVRKIEKKGFERGTPMVFVHQHIDYSHPGPEEEGERPLISEERIHVYLPRELHAHSRVIREVADLPKPQYTFSWTPTPTTLFRFSALTWNGHLIHLDPAYAQNEEGYPERLVHGPLSALMLIEALYHEGYSGRINNFVYRARNPTLVGRRQHVRGAFSPRGDSATLWTEDDDGVVGMTGTVDLLDHSSSSIVA